MDRAHEWTLNTKCTLVLVALKMVSVTTAFAGEIGQQNEQILDAFKKNFPYVADGTATNANEFVGKLAPCANGKQPIVFLDPIAYDKKAPQPQGAISAKVSGKLFVLDCKVADLPGALILPATRSVSVWSSWSGTTSQNTLSGSDVVVLTGMTTGIGHQEFFEADVTLTPNGAEMTAAVKVNDIKAFSPGGTVYVGNSENGPWVYSKAFPSEISLSNIKAIP